MAVARGQASVGENTLPNLLRLNFGQRWYNASFYVGESGRRHGRGYRGEEVQAGQHDKKSRYSGALLPHAFHFLETYKQGLDPLPSITSRVIWHT